MPTPSAPVLSRLCTWKTMNSLARTQRTPPLPLRVAVQAREEGTKCLSGQATSSGSKPQGEPPTVNPLRLRPCCVTGQTTLLSCPSVIDALEHASKTHPNIDIHATMTINVPMEATNALLLKVFTFGGFDASLVRTASLSSSSSAPSTGRDCEAFFNLKCPKIFTTTSQAKLKKMHASSHLPCARIPTTVKRIAPMEKVMPVLPQPPLPLLKYAHVRMASISAIVKGTVIEAKPRPV
mmetsp:Transcript_82824/g.208596  ORF Transcript_82824/g.208596 Transcript_82824/m.208596 type:complete len:237 (-) Transcript_82824:792-1502(-)